MDRGRRRWGKDTLHHSSRQLGRDTLASQVAFNSANDILSILQQYGITDIDVAYRESVFRPSSGPVSETPRTLIRSGM